MGQKILWRTGDHPNKWSICYLYVSFHRHGPWIEMVVPVFGDDFLYVWPYFWAVAMERFKGNDIEY